MENEVKRIPPEKAIALLKEDGIEVTAEQVKVILDFMYEIADIVVDQYLAKPASISYIYKRNQAVRWYNLKTLKR